MANTYTQCYVHLVFSPKHRAALIKKEWADDLERYITGVIQGEGHKLLQIKVMPDHIHIFIGYNINQTLPKLVETIKTSSNKYVSDEKFTTHKFDWQKGYGAFTHSKTQVDAVCKYILNQEEHHKKHSFREEYLDILQKNDIEYDEKYLFDFFDDINDDGC